MSIRKSKIWPDDIETIGIWWLKEEVIDNNSDSKLYAWWGVCKKTKKVAFMRYVTSSIYVILPMVMQDILLSETHGCDDGKYCLNIDCPYATNPDLISAILKQQATPFDELDENKVVDYFERGIKFITKEFIKGLSQKELDKIFVEGYEACHINENAFVTTVGGDDV